VKRRVPFVLCALVAVACAPSGPASSGPASADGAAHAEHERLRRRFQELARRDAVVAEVTREPTDVVVAVRTGLVEELAREVALRYLDRVALDLPLEAHVQESRDVHVSTPVGSVHAGAWTVDVTVHRVRGTLRARTPRVRAQGANGLGIDVPVAIAEGGGTATVHFAWDARKMAGIVCRDFEVTRRLEGRIVPEDYAVSGALNLLAGPDSIRAEPAFPRRTFRVRVDLVPASWTAVRNALEEQDRLLRCGLALDPDEIMPRLEGLLRRGFEVTLPRSLFRAVDLPAGIRHSVDIEDRHVDLSASTRALRVTADAVYYAADVRARGAVTTPAPPPR
jgi:hypothetical protein